MRMSSGAVHRYVPHGPCAEDSVQLRLAIDDRPKSVRQAQPESLIRMFALSKMGKNQDLDWSGGRFHGVQTYPLEVTVNYTMGVKNLESMTYVEELDSRYKNPRDAAKSVI